MERKNTILLTVIAVATLLVAVVGATFAYFTATVTDNRGAGDGQGGTNLTTGQISSTTVVANIDGEAGSFTATDIYPGHKEVAALSIKATGDNGSKTGVTINYDVTANGLPKEHVTVKVYKSESPKSIGTSGNYFQCEKTKEEDSTIEGQFNFFESCSNSDESSLGTLLKTTTLSGGAESNINLATDTLTIATGGEKTVYYYVVVEYLNLDAPQNSGMGQSLAGKIDVVATPV